MSVESAICDSNSSEELAIASWLEEFLSLIKKSKEYSKKLKEISKLPNVKMLKVAEKFKQLYVVFGNDMNNENEDEKSLICRAFALALSRTK